jgi:hypothetical protein
MKEEMGDKGLSISLQDSLNLLPTLLLDVICQNQSLCAHLSSRRVEAQPLATDNMLK